MTQVWLTANLECSRLMIIAGLVLIAFVLGRGLWQIRQESRQAQEHDKQE